MDKESDKKTKQADDAEELKSQLIKTQTELENARKMSQEYLAGWQRAKADFINFKREQSEFISGLNQLSKMELLIKLLPVLDSFEQASKQDKENKGLISIKNQLWDILKKEKMEEISQTGIDFNPSLHESVGETIGKEDNKVGEIVQKGYSIEGKVIRPARVKITKTES